MIDFDRIESIIEKKNEEDFLNKVLLPTFDSEDIVGLMTGKNMTAESRKRLILLFNSFGIEVDDDATSEDLLSISYLINRRAIKMAD